MIYINLFINFFQIGLFSFGGGYAVLPIIQNKIVEAMNWISMSEFSHIIVISQITPGPIGINCATFTGNKIAGYLGGLISTFGCIVPSCIIVGLLALLYKKYNNISIIQNVLKILRPVSVGLIAAACGSIILLTIFNKENLPINLNDINLIAAILIAVCLFAIRKWKINGIFVILASGLIGSIVFYFCS